MEITVSSSVEQFRVHRPSRQKTRLRNGTSILPGVDGRSSWVRRAKELIADHVNDLGGIDVVSAAERSIIRRACVLTVELERLEAKFALAGEASLEDLDLYQRMTNTMRRALESVGLQRRPREINAGLGDLLRQDLVERRSSP
jgi:hypothetical protein